MAKILKKTKNFLDHNATARRAAHSVWLFPALLAIPLILLACLRISGSSAGVYSPIFMGGQSKDPNLIFGNPRSVRSDEFLVTAQMTLAQEATGYPEVNRNFNNGQDMSVVLDVPYKDWSIVFKPQNLAFLVLPFEYAYAFKWWLLLYALIVSCYFLVLEILPSKRLVAILISLGLGLSPFFAWWYLSTTIAPAIYSLLAALFFIRLIKTRKLINKFLLGAGISYALACLALVMYPPFIISSFILTVVLCLGFLLENRQLVFKRNNFFANVVPLLLSIVLAALVVFAFIQTRKNVIEAVNHSAYPGQRVVVSGGYDPRHFLSSFLMPQFQSTARAIHYSTNQSEAANFTLIAPYLAIASIWLVVNFYRKKRKIDWTLLLLNIALLILALRIFIPAGDVVYKILLLDKVPHNRLMLAFGLLGIFQIVFIYRRLQEGDLRIPAVVRWISTVLAVATMLAVGFSIKHSYPGFINSSAKIVLAVLAVTTIIYLVQSKKTIMYGIGLMLVYTIISSIFVNPLYVGAGSLQKNPVIEKITQHNNEKNKNWIYAGNLMLENYPQIAGARAFSGLNNYPQAAFWSKVDNSMGANFIYNRYAHVQFVYSPQQANRLEYVQPDKFNVNFDPCQIDPDMQYGYIVSDKILTSTCINLIDSVSLPQASYYFYEVK